MAHQFGKITVRADGLSGKKAYEYEATVIGILRALDTTQTGHAVLNGLRFHQRNLLIHPYDPKAFEPLGQNGDPIFHQNPNVDRVLRQEHDFKKRCNANVKSTWGMFRTIVGFTPSMWFAESDCVTSWNAKAGHSPHEVLVHELVHAIRYMAGTNRISGRLDWQEEEALAIVVANIFASETHRKLRDPWAPHLLSALDDRNSDSTSSGFLDRYSGTLDGRRLIEKFYRQHRDFTRFLARVQAPWNPVREYFARDAHLARLIGIPHHQPKN